MTRIRSFADAEAVLAQYVPLTAAMTGRDITLGRMRRLMKAVGDPQRQLKIIHVAGTSGKTSTCYYLAQLLTLSGRKTGLTVSPHVDSVRERVQINMVPLSEEEFAASLDEFLQLVQQARLKPTYFELLIGFAYWYFDQAGIEYAVVETGMGGLHDGTNVADNADKVCVITDIGLDHMHVLGSTVAEITRQKAGVIHPGNAVYMHEQPDEVMDIIREQCRSVRTELTIVQQEAPADLRILPDYQKRNWTLAYAVYEQLRKQDNLPEAAIAESLSITVPGRMDVMRLRGKSIILDGAHNEQKMQAFTKSFAERYPGVRVPVLLALKEGKELNAVLPLLRPITSQLVLTEYSSGQDMPVVSIGAQQLGEAARSFGFEEVVIEPNLPKAYEAFLDQPGDVAVITGSFYLIGQLRALYPELKQG